MHGQLLVTAWFPSHRVMENDSGYEGCVSGSSANSGDEEVDLDFWVCSSSCRGLGLGTKLLCEPADVHTLPLH